MKKLGFTLAEVLITLGIIGVVAAMTIPTLITNTNSSKFKAQYKKTLSTLNQAVLLATSKNDLNFASLSGGTCDGTVNLADTSSVCALFNTTLTGSTYFYSAADMTISGSTERYSVKKNVSGGIAVTNTAYQLADGSIISFQYNLSSCTLDVGGDISALPTRCRGYIDVNGTTLPNKEVTCSSGTETTKVASTVGNCIVANNAKDMGDIFPVVFHDSTVEPLTNAARYVLNQAK